MNVEKGGMIDSKIRPLKISEDNQILDLSTSEIVERLMHKQGKEVVGRNQYMDYEHEESRHEGNSDDKYMMEERRKYLAQVSEQDSRNKGFGNNANSEKIYQSQLKTMSYGIKDENFQKAASVHKDTSGSDNSNGFKSDNTKNSINDKSQRSATKYISQGAPSSSMFNPELIAKANLKQHDSLKAHQALIEKLQSKDGNEPNPSRGNKIAAGMLDTMDKRKSESSTTANNVTERIGARLLTSGNIGQSSLFDANETTDGRGGKVLKHSSFLLKNKLQKKNKKIMSILNFSSTKDCVYCSGGWSKSISCSDNHILVSAPKTLMQLVKENLEKKYLTSRDYYNVKVINDIIYNENTHIVSVFKDYLIYDDVSEFLKRFYASNESITRLPKIFEFYEKYSKVFPNYVIIPESKYMFKNIERKQRLIDEKQRVFMEIQSKKSSGMRKKSLDLDEEEDLEGRLFNTKFINSINNMEPHSMINMDASSHYLKNASRLEKPNEESMKIGDKKKLEEMDLDELVSRFIAKDSISHININLLEISRQQISIIEQTKSISDISSNNRPSSRPSGEKFSQYKRKAKESGVPNEKITLDSNMFKQLYQQHMPLSARDQQQQDVGKKAKTKVINFVANSDSTRKEGGANTPTPRASQPLVNHPPNAYPSQKINEVDISNKSRDTSNKRAVVKESIKQGEKNISAKQVPTLNLEEAAKYYRKATPLSGSNTGSSPVIHNGRASEPQYYVRSGTETTTSAKAHSKELMSNVSPGRIFPYARMSTDKKQSEEQLCLQQNLDSERTNKESEDSRSMARSLSQANLFKTVSSGPNHHANGSQTSRVSTQNMRDYSPEKKEIKKMTVASNLIEKNSAKISKNTKSSTMKVNSNTAVSSIAPSKFVTTAAINYLRKESRCNSMGKLQTKPGEKKVSSPYNQNQQQKENMQSSPTYETINSSKEKNTLVTGATNARASQNNKALDKKYKSEKLFASLKDLNNADKKALLEYNAYMNEYGVTNSGDNIYVMSASEPITSKPSVKDAKFVMNGGGLTTQQMLEEMLSATSGIGVFKRPESQQNFYASQPQQKTVKGLKLRRGSVNTQQQANTSGGKSSPNRAVATKSRDTASITSNAYALGQRKQSTPRAEERSSNTIELTPKSISIKAHPSSTFTAAARQQYYTARNNNQMTIPASKSGNVNTIVTSDFHMLGRDKSAKEMISMKSYQQTPSSNLNSGKPSQTPTPKLKKTKDMLKGSSTQRYVTSSQGYYTQHHTPGGSGGTMFSVPSTTMSQHVNQINFLKDKVYQQQQHSNNSQNDDSRRKKMNYSKSMENFENFKIANAGGDNDSSRSKKMMMIGEEIRSSGTKTYGYNVQDILQQQHHQYMMLMKEIEAETNKSSTTKEDINKKMRKSVASKYGYN